jgi:hypothetical protein
MGGWEKKRGGVAGRERNLIIKISFLIAFSA